jgi:hypothetical protein
MRNPVDIGTDELSRILGACEQLRSIIFREEHLHAINGSFCAIDIISFNDDKVTVRITFGHQDDAWSHVISGIARIPREAVRDWHMSATDWLQQVEYKNNWHTADRG